MIQIAPSILNADFTRLGAQVEAVLAEGVRWLHVDVMDGHFVPNISVGQPVVEALAPLAARVGATLEVHLMITEADRYLDDFHRRGATAMTVHVEACPHLHRTVQRIRGLGARPGVGLNPATPLVALEEILPDIDVALIMSVNPGFGGQELIPACLDKVARLRRTLVERRLERIEIEIDGGVKADNIGAVAAAGASIAVAGTAIFNAQASVADNLRGLKAAVIGSCR